MKNAEAYLPHDLDAERAVLGAILINEKKFFEVADIVGAADFFRVAHQQIFHAMHALASKGEKIDYRTVGSFLNSQDLLESAGGMSYLLNITDGVPSSTNAEAYARIVAGKALRAKLIIASQEIIDRARCGENEDVDVVDFAQSSVLTLSERSKGDFVTPAEFASETMALIEARSEGREPPGLKTGWPEIDRMLTLRAGDLVLIAARPSMGKTALALNLADRFTRWQGFIVPFFSLEMSRRQLGVRLLSQVSGLDAQLVGRGDVSQADMVNLSDAFAAVSGSTLYVDDTPDLGVFDLRAKLRKLEAKFGKPKCAIIDYLQLMRMPKAENRNVQVAMVSRSLKLAARELGYPLIVLSQLSRDSARKGDPPSLVDLRDSGALEQDADTVIFVHRPEVYEETPENRGVAEIIIGKQRDGPIGKAKLYWQPKQQRFVNRYWGDSLENHDTGEEAGAATG